MICMRRLSVLLPLVVFVAFFAGLTAVAANEPANLEGHWEGAIELPTMKLDVTLEFTLAEGAWKGSISIPAQNAKDVPLKDVALEGAQARFTISGIPGEPTFEGEVSADGATITGDFTQGGQTFPFTLTSGEHPAAKARQALEGIGDIVSEAIADWKTPGLALGIVVGGEVVLAAGYGYRDLERELPVTPQTVFAIGSCTKAFTAFVLGTLVDEGKLDWDTPLIDLLPDFKLYDEYATNHIKPLDLINHRSGLPRHDMVWYNNEDISRRELVRRLRYLEPNKELRELWQYNNLMYLTAGYLTEHLTGQAWEDVVRERIFEPLDMVSSNFSVEVSQQAADFALPYMEKKDEILPIPFRPITVMGPAGSINASIEDMVNWVKLQLGNGALEGQEVISPGTLFMLQTPQMVMPGQPDSPEETPRSYASGWMVSTWRGHYRLLHGGNIDGFSALVMFFPNDDLGIVTLSNRSADPLPGHVTKTVADLVLELEPRDWIGDAAVERDEIKTFVDEGQEKKELFRKKKTKPSHKLEKYAGEYEHPGYGVVTIEREGKQLTAIYNDMVMPLDHWHFDVFSVMERDDEVIPEDLKIVFHTDARGVLSRLTMSVEQFVDPIAFERLPDRRLRDPAFLQRLVGDYEVPGQMLKVTLQGNVLRLQAGGQPTLELEPKGADEFTVKGIGGIEIRFVLEDEGPASELIIIQAGGVFTAPRVAEQ